MGLAANRLEGDPVPSAVRVVDDEAGGFERRADLGLAVEEDAGREEHAARTELRAKRPGQRDQDRRDQVGEDDVDAAPRRSAGCRRGR